jgi:DNA repair protein RecO
MGSVGQQIEAIILDAKTAQGGSALVSALTPTQGLVKIWAKGALLPTSPRRMLIQPLTRVELILRPARDELHTLVDGLLLEVYPLREQLSHLTAALHICQTLLSTQLPSKPAPALYQLLSRYLTHLPHLPPAVATTSFRLKLLLHEGLLSPDELTPLATIRSFDELKSLSVTDEEENQVAQLFRERVN